MARAKTQTMAIMFLLSTLLSKWSQGCSVDTWSECSYAGALWHMSGPGNYNDFDNDNISSWKIYSSTSDLECCVKFWYHGIARPDGKDLTQCTSTGDTIEVSCATSHNLDNAITEITITRTQSQSPTKYPTETPTQFSTKYPTKIPTQFPTKIPTQFPTELPTKIPTEFPTKYPTETPTQFPTKYPTETPTNPTQIPSLTPSNTPTKIPTKSPTKHPTDVPTKSPSDTPTQPPTQSPTTTPIAERGIEEVLTTQTANKDSVEIEHTDSGQSLYDTLIIISIICVLVLCICAILLYFYLKRKKQILRNTVDEKYSNQVDIATELAAVPSTSHITSGYDVNIEQNDNMQTTIDNDNKTMSASVLGENCGYSFIVAETPMTPITPLGIVNTNGNEEDDDGLYTEPTQSPTKGNAQTSGNMNIDNSCDEEQEHDLDKLYDRPATKCTDGN